MSAQYLDLVAELTPPGRHYHVESPSAHRTRFVLFMLAYLADDEGRCTASLNDLHARTTLQPAMIRAALQELESEHGFVEITRQSSAPNTYRLLRAALEAKQFVNMLRAGEPSVELLAWYGLDVRSINALQRGDISTLEQLDAKIAAYRQADTSGEQPFHRFLDLRGLGERTARKVLTCYAMWQDEQHAPS